MIFSTPFQSLIAPINMPETLEQLRRRRGAAKGWLTRCAAHLSTLLDDESTIQEVLESAASDFDERLTSLDSLQLELESRLDDDAAIEEDIQQDEDFRRYVCGIRASAQQSSMNLCLF